MQGLRVAPPPGIVIHIPSFRRSFACRILVPTPCRAVITDLQEPEECTPHVRLASTSTIFPMRNCKQYLEDAAKPLESQAFFVKAACMCADISGFTALSEKHCKKGTAGLDTLVQASRGVV